jgi:hypothetical protein
MSEGDKKFEVSETYRVKLTFEYGTKNTNNEDALMEMQSIIEGMFADWDNPWDEEYWEFEVKKEDEE